LYVQLTCSEDNGSHKTFFIRDPESTFFSGRIFFQSEQWKNSAVARCRSNTHQLLQVQSRVYVFLFPHQDYTVIEEMQTDKAGSFLRATAVPAGTAERVLAMAILSVRPSVRLSVRHDPVPNQAQVR